MEEKNFFENIYNDFFGIEKLTRENEKLAEELHLNDKEYPKIEINKKPEQEAEQELTAEEIKAKKDNQMAKFFERLEKLYITEESKNTLKKMIEYMRKYCEKIEKQYISFNMCLYTNNKETMYEIVDIFSDAATFFAYIKQGDTIETSLYNVEKAEQLNDIYGSKNSVVLIRDFEGLVSQEQTFKNKFMHTLQENIMKNSNQVLTILCSKNKEILMNSFENNNDIKEKLFNFEIVSINPDIQDVYQEILNKLTQNNKTTKEFSVKLLDYISVTYPNITLSYPEYRDKLCEKILFSKTDEITENDIPKYEKEKTMEEVFEELNNLVGLEKVKQVLKDLVSLIELKNKTKDDLKIKDTNLHMVFLGNPGTGKTTVARLIAQILYNLKYVKQNKLIEVSSKDLVAEYVGQTAPKTMSVVEKALGGVLFIDEAYSLSSGHGEGNSFNEEAIATLIQAMENYRDNLVVIFAGYTREMQDFLNANSGIVSRIGYTLEFDDYTEDELIKIFKSMMKKSGFTITNEAIEKVRAIITEYKNTKNFGNARFIRNIYEKSIIKHAANTQGKHGKKILTTIDVHDISDENLLKM